MKKKINHSENNSQNRPIEVSAQDLSIIRARESSRTRRSNIEWL